MESVIAEAVTLDLARMSVREVNHFLHHEAAKRGVRRVEIQHPDGTHSIAVAVNAPLDIEILGHAGYYIGGLCRQAKIVVHGNVGWGVAENLMSGSVRVKGTASECAGASGHGGLLVIEGDASSRCGISLKGLDIVVGGSVGHASAFMAQAGRLVVCGDAGVGLGDSLYEAVIYVHGKIAGFGADAHQEDLTDADVDAVGQLLQKARLPHAPRPEQFKRIASKRSLYHWNSDHHQDY